MSDKFSKSACRVCGHFHWGAVMPTILVSNCVHYPPFEMANCKCTYKDYVPSDNLDYIEWLADKRGLV